MLRENSPEVGHGDKCELVASDGKDVSHPYEDGGRKFNAEQVRSFAANLNWLCLRTAYYNLAAPALGGDAILHPIRSGFSLSFAEKKLGLQRSTRTYIADLLKEPASQVLRDIKSASDPTVVQMDLPFFSAWIASRNDDPDSFLSTALELREHPKVRQLRDKLGELEQQEAEGDHSEYVKSTNATLRAIQQSTISVRSEFGVDTASGVPTTSLVNLGNAALTGVGQAPLIPDPVFIVPGTSRIVHGWKSRGYRGVFRSVIQDLSAISRLGGLHEKITRGVRRKKDARFAEPKIEDVAYRKARPYWKIPM